MNLRNLLEGHPTTEFFTDLGVLLVRPCLPGVSRQEPFRALPLVALSLLVLGGAAALAQRQLRSAAPSGRPAVKVSLSGSGHIDLYGGATVDDYRNTGSGEIAQH